MSHEGLKLKLSQVSHENIDGVINVFQALAKVYLPSEEWRDILVNAHVAGDPDLSDKLHDYLMEHGGDILTKEDLISSIEKLK